MKLAFFFLVFCLTVNLFAQEKVSLIVQSGHSGPVTDVVFSADDRFIITSGEDKRIVIWDRTTQKQFGVLQGHNGPVNALCIVPDDPDHVYSVSDDGLFIKWHILSEKVVSRISIGGTIGAIEYCPVTKKFAIGSKIISLVTENMDSLVNYGGTLATSQYLKVAIEDIAFDKTGSAVICTDGNKRVMNFDLGGEKDAEIISIKPFTAVEYGPTGKHIYATNYSGGISKYRLGTYSGKRSPLWTRFVRNSDLLFISNNRMAAGNEKGDIVFVSPRSLWPRGKIKAHNHELAALGLNSDSSLIASATVNGEIKVWSIKSRELLETYNGVVGRINDVAFNESGRYIAVGYNDGVIKVFDLETFNTMELDAASEITRITDRKKAMCRNLRWDGDRLVINLLKTKTSNELLWMYDYIKDVELTWNPFTNEVSDYKYMPESKIVSSYYANVQSHIRFGSPHLTDSMNLQVNDEGHTYRGSLEYGTIRLSKGEAQLATIAPFHSDIITAMAANPQGQFVATASWDGLVRLWDENTGQLKLTLGLFEEGQFVVIDPENYYFSSKVGLNNLGFKYKQEVFSFEQFDLKYNRPDKVLAQLSFVHDKEMISSYYKAYGKRLQRLSVQESDLELSNDVPVMSTVLSQTDPSHVKLEMNATSNSAELSRLHVYVNGVPEYGKAGSNISGKKLDEDVDVRLSPGRNVIQTHVTAANGLASLKREAVVNGAPVTHTRTLYLLTIGASEFDQQDFNLVYASKDAADIAQYFSENNPMDSLVVMELKNRDVTLENVKELKNQLKNVEVYDALILFVAGHGVLSEDLDFYFSSYDIDFSSPADRGIPYTVLEDLVDDCRSRYKCFLLDACHSGEFDKEEVQLSENKAVVEGEVRFRHVGTNISSKGRSSFELSKALFADTRPNSGTTVISSAGGAEYALEGGKWKNGVFTYAFIEGLSTGAADLNNDGDIYLSEIHKYVAKKVTELTEGKQTPTSRVENAYNDFKIR